MAAHAKRFVPDAAVKAANTCTQVLGGMGLLQPYGLDRLSRLAQMLRIVDGTTEISRVVIGRALQKRAAELPDLRIPKGFGEADEATCLAPYIRPLIFGFSNRVSGAGGRMFNA